MLSTDKKRQSITGNENIDRNIDNITKGKVFDWISKYEDVIGLTEVKLAQCNVLEAERCFIDKQGERSDKGRELDDMQSRLNAITTELDKVKKGDEGYMSIIKDEYDIIKKKRILTKEHKDLERLEQKSFSLLSSSLRESHEKERSRTEKIKYWSLVGSIIGACIGVMGTSINNYHRMNVIKAIVTESVEDTNDMRLLVQTLSQSIEQQRDQFTSFISETREAAAVTLATTTNDSLTADASLRLQEVGLQHSEGAELDKFSTITTEVVRREVRALRDDLKRELTTLNEAVRTSLDDIREVTARLSSTKQEEYVRDATPDDTFNSSTLKDEHKTARLSSTMEEEHVVDATPEHTFNSSTSKDEHKTARLSSTIQEERVGDAMTDDTFNSVNFDSSTLQDEHNTSPTITPKDDVITADSLFYRLFLFIKLYFAKIILGITTRIYSIFALRPSQQYSINS